ncbi:MAG: arginase family protein [Desulfobulbus sp.]|jgi:agmatinase
MHFLNLSTPKASLPREEAVILPVLYGGTDAAAASVSKGATAILAASQMLSTFDVETKTDFNELGIRTLSPVPATLSLQETVEQVATLCTPFFRKHTLVAAIGGNYQITEGLVRAAVLANNGLSVVHLGAHPHLLDPDDQSLDVMGRIKELCPVSHLGIRSMRRAEHAKLHEDNLVFARDLYATGLNAAVDALDVLDETVYLAIDLDVLDPACMPAVEWPEPGGLDWYGLNNLIRMVAREKMIIGFDITGLVVRENELSPQMLAAKLLYKTLICCIRNNR